MAPVLSDFQSAEQFTVVFLIYPLMQRFCSHVTIVFFSNFFPIILPKIGPIVIVHDRDERNKKESLFIHSFSKTLVPLGKNSVCCQGVDL